jgi:hypothetical protein
MGMNLPVQRTTAFVQTYYADMEGQQRRTIGRWWNGTWGRLARRDIRLTREPDGTLLLEWWSGDDTLGGSRRYPAAEEAEAVAAVVRLIEEAGGQWRDLTEASQPRTD